MVPNSTLRTIHPHTVNNMRTNSFSAAAAFSFLHPQPGEELAE